MIHKILMAYLSENKSKPLSPDIWLFIVIAFMSLIFLMITLTSDLDGIEKSAFLIVIIILSFTMFSCVEKAMMKKWQNNYKNYNEKLDNLALILKEKMKYRVDGNEKHWYSKEKIEFLIESGEDWISEQVGESSEKRRVAHFAQILLFPVIAFVADVSKDKISLDTAISFGVLVIFCLSIGYVTNKLISVLANTIMKSTSIEQMQTLVNLLKNLMVRDFT